MYFNLTLTGFGSLQSAGNSLSGFDTALSPYSTRSRGHSPQTTHLSMPWLGLAEKSGGSAVALPTLKGGLRTLYRTLELPGKNPLRDAHEALNTAVLAAYGFSPKKDLLAQLLALNLEVARREEAGEPVTAPGIPPGYPEPARLVTEDCIRAD